MAYGTSDDLMKKTKKAYEGKWSLRLEKADQPRDLGHRVFKEIEERTAPGWEMRKKEYEAPSSENPPKRRKFQFKLSERKLASHAKEKKNLGGKS